MNIHPNSIGSKEFKIMNTIAHIFENTPNPHAEIVNRITLGNYVIDREKVTGFPHGREINVGAIYLVQTGYIQKKSGLLKNNWVKPGKNMKGTYFFLHSGNFNHHISCFVIFPRTVRHVQTMENN